MIKLNALFQFGISALHYDSTRKANACHIFIDTGWREPTSGYDSYPGEQMTLISVLLQEVPHPKKDDRIIVGNQKYEVVAIQSQDDVIAVLNVKTL